MSNKSKQWKQKAINKTGTIADAFSVFIAGGGNLAIWILFLCLVANIIQVVISVPDPIANGILVVQVITLDIAGFGLKTIAKSLLKHKDVEVQAVASGAKNLANWLIILMVVNLLLLTGKLIIPQMSSFVDIADKVLILARVIFTVVYMHTMHELRETAAEVEEQEEKQVEANNREILQLSQQVKTLTTQLDTLSLEQQKNLQLIVTEEEIESKLSASEKQFTQEIEALQSVFEGQIEKQMKGFTMQLETLHSTLQSVLEGEIERRLKGFSETFTEGFNLQLETLQCDLHSTFQSALQHCSEEHIEAFILSLLDAKMKAFNETLTTIKKTVSVTMEQSSTHPSRPQETRMVKAAKPAVAQLPAPKDKENIDRKTVVYEVLSDNREMSIAEIKMKALEEYHVKISEGSISKYRAQFFNEVEGVSSSKNERQNETQNERQIRLVDEDYEDENETQNERQYTEPLPVVVVNG
jgi:hypothetical protein